MKRLFIVRHGETEYNATHRWQGHLQTALSETGLKQAQSLADYFANQAFDAIYSSDLIRAFDTAKPIAERLQLTIQTDNRLREVHLGQFQGLTRQEIQTRFPDAYQSWNADHAFIVPDGESRQQLQARVVESIDHIAQTSTGDRIMIITHGGSIRMWMLHWFPDHSCGNHVPNTSVTTVGAALNDDGQMHYTLLDCFTTPHLNID